MDCPDFDSNLRCPDYGFSLLGKKKVKTYTKNFKSIGNFTNH